MSAFKWCSTAYFSACLLVDVLSVLGGWRMLASGPETCKVIVTTGRVLGGTENMHNEIKYKSISVIVKDVLTRSWEVMLEVPWWLGIFIKTVSFVSTLSHYSLPSVRLQWLLLHLLQTVLKGGKKYHLYLVHFLINWLIDEIAWTHFVCIWFCKKTSVMIGGVCPFMW